MAQAMNTKHLNGLIVGLLLAAPACKEKNTATLQSDAGAIFNKPALDPNLAEAVQAAAPQGKSSKAARRAPGEPPANGVFAPGEAEKELPGGVARINIGNEGREPRLLLGGEELRAGKRSGVLRLQLTTGPRQGLPPLEIGLNFQFQKANPTAEPEPSQSAKASPAAEGGLVDVRVDITSVKLFDAADVPREFSAKLSKLRGSRIEYRLARNGAGSDFRYTAAKGVEPGFESALQSLRDGVASMTLPVPDKPLGSGGYYMAITREPVAGMDVLSYRLVKITDVKGEQASLNVTIKRYAMDNKFELASAPEDLGALTIEQFQATSEGTLEVVTGMPLVARAELTQLTDIELSAKNKPGQRLGVQSQSESVFTLNGVTLGVASAGPKRAPQ